ncbi:MAG: hypothetical protein A2534_01935 [Candidatus Magasanikbacteria bacterium RIFOXYD2_FULL_39_9]|uniref:Uncharacterized protein n=1 Tax=Candidatus Magasanikbacteria bacterium RIFOXYD1_FULL_40_23 TaxID=1798705 RepID=A0A1F6P967_9BACT|nr:MAG: hypothetical protein A2534_01935 [Candidatus Magasanikbacteria bacterium RIFOXYD2_FULL_39_9]OGH92717.1 MAG: hypothetical protein A2563_03540 [Candidatus Magasanikbacteria bacterium RIFOXYD1_FULL_40_23]
MRIRVRGEVYNGRTAVELVSHMRSDFNAFARKPASSNAAYMDRRIQWFKAHSNVEVVRDGTTEEDQCLSFIRSMVNGGLAEEIT